MQGSGLPVHLGWVPVASYAGEGSRGSVSWELDKWVVLEKWSLDELTSSESIFCESPRAGIPSGLSFWNPRARVFERISIAVC